MDPTQTVALHRLLVHLDRSLKNESAMLQSSRQDRARVLSNIDYARTLLLTLDKYASTVRVQSQRQRIQADLQQKRETIKRLSHTIQEYEQADAGAESSDEAESEDEHVVTKERQDAWAPGRRDVDAGLHTGERPAPLLGSSNATQELRARRGASGTQGHQSSETTAREALFSNRSQTQDHDSRLSTHEAVLSHNRTQQEVLTTSLLSLATQLKQSSQAFSSSLESEKEVLSRAEGGLEQSSKGMEAAERRMGTLRRMSEGQGWLGRLKLYGMIGGLWLACFLIVFVGPKLRF